MLKRRTYGRVISHGRKMASYVLLLVVVVCFSVSFGPFWLNPVRAAAITWDGGGADSDWCTDLNWSNDTEPTTADDVTISKAQVTDITTSGCVTEGHTLNFSTLTVGGGVANQNSLTIEANIGTGGSITIGSDGTIIQKNTTTQVITGTLTIQSGGTLTHFANTNTQAYEVDFQAATINILAGGSVNVDGKGFAGGITIANGSGTGPGIYEPAGGDGSGGAHSGAGGATLGGTAGGTAYCDNNNPSTLGSGAGGSNGGTGGAGGGLVRLVASGTLNVYGTISANGGNGVSGGANKDGGGGGGGGIWLNAATIGFSGIIRAVGGNSSADNNEGGGGGGGCTFLNYTTAYSYTGATTSTVGGTGANAGGAGSHISNALPTVTSITPAQIVAGTVSTTVTIADLDNNATSLIVEYSTNGTTWASSTLANVTPSEGAVTTSTGNIAGIDTNLDGSVNLAIEWNAGVDVSNTDDTSVYLRFVPKDSVGGGTTVTTGAFAVDTKDPTRPGALTVYTTSTTSVDPKFGSATVDTGFKEYKIFYSNSTPVTTADSSLTSSTDANLGLINFGGASTTTISGLTSNTRYYANIWAYDTWASNASSTSEIDFYTLTGNPTGLATTTVGMTSAAFTVDAFTNPTAGSSGYFYDLIDAADVVTTTRWTSARTWTVPNLTVNSSYGVRVNYRNGDGISATTSTLSFYTLTSVPANVTAVADSKTQITVSWTGDGTTYYVENTTAGTNSGWITATSYAFTNLTAGTTYSFRVKAKNNGDAAIVGYSVETAWGSTVSATTQSEGGGGPLPNPPGGGGGDPPPPQCEGQDCQPKKPTGQVGGYILINDDASKTTSADVNLNLYFTKFVSTYAVANAVSLAGNLTCDFSGKSFEDIGVSKVFNDNYNTKVVPFSLSAGFGTKKACVRYRGSLDGGKNFVDYDVFDTILFEEVSEPKVPTPEPPKPPAPEEPLPENPPANPPAVPPSNPVPEGGGEPPPGVPSGGGEPEPGQPPGGGPASPDQGGPSGGSPSSPSQPVQEAESVVVEIAAGIPSAVKETAEILNVVVIEPAVKAIKKVIDNPKIEKANEVVVAPAIILAGAANVAVGFNATQLLLTLRYIFSQPLLLLRLRKRKSWGVIYNALNKMPVDLAVVRLVEESTGRIVQSQVTDAQGRYLISAEPGEYHLEVDKAGFSGFSKLLRDKEEDAKFIHLYHGGKFQITETEIESVLNYNIPLDPVDEVKGNNLVIKEYTKRVTQNVICVIGLLASVLSFVVSPKLIIFAFVLLHLMFYWLFYRFSHKKVTAGSFGSVTEMMMEEPISKAVVRVFDSMYNKLVDTTVTDRKGRYAILVGPSKYYTTYEKDGFEKKQSEVLDFSSEKTNGMGGLINRDEELKKIDK